ncbi:MAG: mandelate racemase/muconate lactonizing enzyme family protein [Spirochaetales bacterium]
MKVKSIETFILRVPLGKERFYSSQTAFPERNSLLIRIETDEGIVGWGEGGQYGPPEPPAACIHHVLAPLILGKDPMDRAVLWEKMYGLTRDFGQKGPYLDAISGIDIALWDIAGKYTGLPISTLLGGRFRSEVQAYATGHYYRGEDVFDYKRNLPLLKEEAQQYVGMGFRILKAKIGLLPLSQDIERLAAIREAVGPSIQLLVDANHAYNVGTAGRICRELEKMGGILWFEEPVPPEDYQGYKALRSFSSIPIAGGECEFTRFGFRELLVRGCVDILQPDLGACGGFSEFRTIEGMARAFHVPVIPHVWGSAVALASALQAIASLPPFPYTALPIPLENEPVIEYDRNPNPLRDSLATEPFTMKEGKVLIPEKPGIGITLDLDTLKKFTTETRKSTVF